MNDDAPTHRRVAVAVTSAAVIAAAGVGAYVLSGDQRDNAAAATTSVSTTAVSATEATGPVETVAATDPEANAGGPVPTTARPTTTTVRVVVTTTTTLEAAGGPPNGDYAANRPLIAVSPATVRAGKPVEFEVKRFPKRTRLTVAVVSNAGATVQTLVVTTSNDGTAKGRFTAPARGTYTVTATAASPAATASTRLTVS